MHQSRISVRELSIQDVSVMHKWHNDKALYSFLVGHFYGPSLEEEKKWIDNYLNNHNNCYRGIVSNEDSIDIGCVYLTDIDRKNKTGQVHLFIQDPIYRRKGYGREMINFLIHLSFYSYGLETIYLNVLNSNKNTFALYHSLGFKDTEKHITDKGETLRLVLNKKDSLCGKRLMILGGSRFILPIINYCHKQGVYVITCDYLPNNIAHQYSDEYINVSIIDKEKVLEVARGLKIDGISSFACDPGVVTAAYVAEKLRLPNVGPYKSVKTLQNKGLFRTFLSDNNFNVPSFKIYKNIEDALLDKETIDYPVIVKPTDSAGSKGVKKVNNKNELEEAVKNAFDKSLSKEIIVEEIIDKEGEASSGDYFSVDGKLVFSPFTDQIFDNDNIDNVYNPCGTKLPTSLPLFAQKELESELQRLIKLLGMKTSIYNYESRLSHNGKTYIMEVSPRGGGNKIAELESLLYEFDFFEYIVKSYFGIPFNFPLLTLKHPGFIYVLHSKSKGIYRGIGISEDIEPFLIEKDIFIREEDYIDSFDGANKSVGFLKFLFDSNEQCIRYRNEINNHIKVLVDE